MKSKDSIHTSKITNVIEENYRVKTFVLDYSLKAKPGQFVMLWVPDMDEKPFSIANDDPLTLTVAKVGPFSTTLHELKNGDVVSFRGPFGTSFQSKGIKSAALIAGGYGVVPLYFLAKELKKNGAETTVLIGAKSANDIIYEKNFWAVSAQVYITTDDGTKGTAGFCTDKFRSLLLEGKKFDRVYGCGPEGMLKALAIICEENNINYELSLERQMKCGIGICGSCALGDKLVCKDGPVFREKDLKRMKFL